MSSPMRRVIFPLLGLNQLTVGVYGRAITEGHEPRHLYQAGRRQGLFRWAAARQGKELLLVESVICLVSLLAAQVMNAIPLCGLSIPPEPPEVIERIGIESIVLGLDGGEHHRRPYAGRHEEDGGVEEPQQPTTGVARQGADS